MAGVFPRKKPQPSPSHPPVAPQSEDAPRTAQTPLERPLLPAQLVPKPHPAPTPAPRDDKTKPVKSDARQRRSTVMPRPAPVRTEPARPEPAKPAPPRVEPPKPATPAPTKKTALAEPSLSDTPREAPSALPRAKAPVQLAQTETTKIREPEKQAPASTLAPGLAPAGKLAPPGPEKTRSKAEQDIQDFKDIQDTRDIQEIKDRRDRGEIAPGAKRVEETVKAPEGKRRGWFGLGGARGRMEPVIEEKPVESVPEKPAESRTGRGLRGQAEPVSEEKLVPEPPRKPAGPRLPLRVALDLRTWEMSGLGTYVRELLAAFGRLKLPVQWTFIGPESLKEKLPPGLNIERWHDFAAPIYGSSGFLHYPKLREVDLFHYPHYNLPLTRAPRRLVTVFDLFHLRYGSWAKRQYQSFFMRRLRWAGQTHLVTASAKTGRELMEFGMLPRERIAMIPLGPGRMPARRPKGPPPALNSLAGTPVRAPWLLVTGIDQPHKNFDFMLSALSLYFQRRPESPPLVWVGLDPESLKRRSRQLPAHVKQKVVLEPYTSDERLEAIYTGAGALLFPSLDEGFGFPPLEAMAWGIPVICARREPMTAILGDAPLYFEPSESASLWRALDRLLDDPDLRQDLTRRGRHCASLYSWEATANKTFKLYAHLISLDGTEAEEPRERRER